MSSPFMPPSQFENHPDPQTPPDVVFSNRREPPPHTLPQTLPATTQFPHDMSLQGQKQTSPHLEFGDYVLQAPQHCDPTFYGLSASLPMSTYVTTLSPPPSQISNKRIRQATQNVQSSSNSGKGRPQASPSYVSRSLASSRPKTFYRSQSTRSRHGHGPNERCQSAHSGQQVMSNTLTRSIPSTNPCASGRPRTWNWLNTLNASGTSLNILDQHYQNFTFTWPTLNEESQTTVHLENLRQGPGQLQQTSLQSISLESAAQPAPSHQNHVPFGSLQSLKDMPETRNSYFGCGDAQTEENRLVDGSLGLPSTVTSWSSQRELSPPQNKTQRTNSRKKSINISPFPDLPELPDFDTAMFALLPDLDHDFGFEPDFAWDIEGDINTPSNARKSTKDPDIQILPDDIKNHIPHDSSDESALLEFLQPVISYLASDSYSPRNCLNDTASQAISVSEGVGGRPAGDKMSLAGDRTSSFSVLQSQSRVDLCPATVDTESRDMVEVLPTNWGTGSEIAASDASLSTTSPIGSRGALEAPSTLLKENSMLPPPADHDLYRWSLQSLGTTSRTIPIKASAIDNTISTSVDASVDVNSSSPPSPEGRDSDGRSRHSTPRSWSQAKSSAYVSQSPPKMLLDMEEWLGRRDTDLDQPVTAKCKTLPTPEGKGICGWQVVWADGDSQMDSNQPRPTISNEGRQLQAIRRRIEISRNRGAPWSLSLE